MTLIAIVLQLVAVLKCTIDTSQYTCTMTSVNFIALIFLSEIKLMHGDELRLRYLGDMHKPWSGVGHVIKIADSILETKKCQLS